MSDQTTIFQQNSQATPAPDQATTAGSNQSQGTTFEDLLGMVTNENGERKYRDVPSALQGLQHAQTFISQLKSENAQLKQEMEGLRIQTQKIAELEQTIKTLTANVQNPPEQRPEGAVLNEQTLAEILDRKLSEREREAQRAANISKVVNSVREKFGDKAEEVFYGKAKELGMTVAEINELASKSPTAVLGLIGVSQAPAQPFKSPVTPGSNTEGYTPPSETFVKSNAGVLLGASYQELVAEKNNATKMIDELAAKGLSINSLTDPKVYFQHFN